jgi:hypothetical protein
MGNPAPDAEADVNINPIVAPGDVFTMGEIRTWGFANDYENWYGGTWWVPGVLDIDFGHRSVDGVRTPSNPWGEHPVNPANNNWGESGKTVEGSRFLYLQDTE